LQATELGELDVGTDLRIDGTGGTWKSPAGRLYGYPLLPMPIPAAQERPAEKKRGVGERELS